jgi:hypothetical protein
LAGTVLAVAPAAAAVSDPTITEVSPSTVRQNQTADLTIVGSNFRPGLRPVVLNGYVDVQSYQYVDQSTITAHVQVSPGSPVGPTDVALIDDSNNTWAGNPCTGCLTVDGIVVSGVSPETINRGEKKVFTIAGSGFDQGTVITNDGGTLVSWSIDSPTQATVDVVVGDGGIFHVGLSFTTSYGGRAGTAIQVTHDITVSSVTPGVVRDPATTDIVLRGRGFAGPGPTGNISIEFWYPGQPHNPWATTERSPSVVRWRRDSYNQITVTVRTDASTHLGAHNVIVNTNDGSYGVCEACLTVEHVGYTMLDAGGDLFAFGDAPAARRPSLAAGASAVHIEYARRSDGYWVLDSHGTVHAVGANTPLFGQVAPSRLAPGERLTSISATPSGSGYWLFSSKGRVFPFGDAGFFSDMSGHMLNSPVLGSVPTPTGRGYYMVASDGGIFAFGDAVFHGSMGGSRINQPVRGIVPDGDGVGYWLVAADGGVFSFDASFRGSMGSVRLNRPIVGMVPFGNGYLMVAGDGGVFVFSDRPFLGSLGDNPPATPVVSIVGV